METLAFIFNNLPAIGQRTIEHLSIVGVAVGLAILTGVPIGIAITQNKRAADIVLYVAAMIMTIPSVPCPECHTWTWTRKSCRPSGSNPIARIPRLPAPCRGGPWHGHVAHAAPGAG